MTQQLRAGDPAPALALADHEGREVDLAGLRGRRVIVYFYPKAFTPGCTSEACDFRDNLASLESLGYTVLGVSADDRQTLARFAEEHALPYRLLSDPESATARAWGAWGEKSVGGETRVGPLRSTFVVDEQGTIASAEYDVQAQGHVARLREQLAA
ncbi:peroxiredoxin [Kocuria flava]|uniref:thioredoxin-dependent peroxiredoxin n=1 Tax=Kocuria flava TaxID=446860 RepID=A0A0U2NY26_9MICC|nr:thioredoxin-dependent thiol peroxidase [Kocuria flava]ALU39213.1 peroxiredoxin [Kocuria flava]MCJ8505511.1 thioredoxin-dependent thiol peroxidase [Kocuria flava]GEO91250.1 peroxiredoxin [Kocuria flava]